MSSQVHLYVHVLYISVMILCYKHHLLFPLAMLTLGTMVGAVGQEFPSRGCCQSINTKPCIQQVYRVSFLE